MMRGGNQHPHPTLTSFISEMLAILFGHAGIVHPSISTTVATVSIQIALTFIYVTVGRAEYMKVTPSSAVHRAKAVSVFHASLVITIKKLQGAAVAYKSIIYPGLAPFGTHAVPNQLKPCPYNDRS